MPRPPEWTDGEDEVIRRHYRSDGAAAVAALLPRRSIGAVQHRASVLGCTARPDWSPSEDKQLLMLWESGRVLQYIATRLGRPLHGVYNRAVKLGLAVGCPRGFEYLSDAVARCGLNSTTQLRRILDWAGVAIHEGLYQPKRDASARAWHRHYVEPVAVDEAVAKWVRSETMQEAARRYGISGMIMRKWLLRAGVVEQRPRRMGPQRVETAVIDRVMRERALRLAELAVFGRAPQRVQEAA